jgi:hypothetical protein
MFGIIIITLCVLCIDKVNYNHNRYNVKTFNCVDFTKESINGFKMFGITSYQVVGMCKDNHSLGHSWVGIDIFGYIIHYEPQGLVIFNPEDDYYDIYVNKR